MSGITLTKLNRKFQEDKDGHAFKRSVELPREERQQAGLCYLCGLPVYSHNGQLLQYVLHPKTGQHLYSHKKCRKSYRT